MVELKKCPFCGGEAELNHINNIGEWDYEVRCPYCGVGTDCSENSEVAIADWNLRVKEK